MTDFERQRLTMVETQLRPNQVTDPRLLAAMRTLPRERFVPQTLGALAYMDGAIEVFPSIDGAPARFMLSPMVLGPAAPARRRRARRPRARCRLCHRLFDRRARPAWPLGHRT